MVRIDLPALYPLQVEIVDHPALRKVVVAGRRGGKTTMFATLAVERALATRKKVMMVSPLQDQVDIFWRKLKDWLAEPLTHKLIQKNEVKRTLTFWNGSTIRCKTGHNPDALRGEDADLLIFDECALLDPATWYSVGAAMLADRANSEAVFISTPKYKNWFYHLYLNARADTSGLWQAFHFPSHANPHLAGLDIATAGMPDTVYRQEILAEFLEMDGAVFRNIENCVYGDYPDTAYKGHFIMAVDWGRTNDYTVALVGDADTGRIVDKVRFTNVRFEEQIRRIMMLAVKWQVELIVAEANAMGGPLVEQLRIAADEYANFNEQDTRYLSTSVSAFTMTAVNKPRLVEALMLAFEQGDIQIPNDPDLLNELETFSLLRQNQLGLPTYGAPLGMHDDMVITLAILWKQLTSISEYYIR